VTGLRRSSPRRHPHQHQFAVRVSRAAMLSALPLTALIIAAGSGQSAYVELVLMRMRRW